MGIWRVGADVLAGSRFTVSPLAQTVAALNALHKGRAAPGRQAWLREHRPAYRERLDGDRVEALLVWAALRPTWLADFLITPPRDDDRTFHDELRRVRQTPAEVAAADLAVAVGAPLPAELRVPDLPARAAALLEWVWTATVQPEWPRLRRVFEADIVSRTGHLGTGGWAAALAGLRPGLRWLGDGRLRINPYDNPPRHIADDAQLLFIPTTTTHGWVTWDTPHRYAIIYPCTGFLAAPPALRAGENPTPPPVRAGTAPPAAVRALIGPVRAGILAHLGEPRSTTHLVALTGHSLGSVGGHLKVLLAARLIDRRRSGRSVLYYRTPLGDRLLNPE
ncbi:transcriptional regulator [Sphaerisporangium sp. B11E5]|uniref:ArsR/SmtB family transcription factor n=1 Tax=Sphaerisporangium sp. B11E5 TaxID=3153563 RepID=UPI00325DCDAE